MSNSTIGIKIANGEYYPVLTEGSHIRRRLVLTTVNDNQESVQIDLYKGEGETIDSAVYVGSLLIEEIEPTPQGEPEIELVLGVDDDGTLNATASDSKSGERQSLSVSLNALEGPDEFEIPDFELNKDAEDMTVMGDEPEGDQLDDDDFFGDLDMPSRVSPHEESGLTGGDGFPSYQGDSQEEPQEKKRINPLLLIGFILAGLAIAVLILLLLLKSFPGEPVPPLNAEGTPAQEAPEEAEGPPAEEVAEAPAEEAPQAVEVPEAPPAEEEPAAEAPAPEAPAPPAAEPEKPSAPRSVVYRIKKGDTLWDLSNSFYRTPWLYRKIARDNNISNPDLIYAGTDLNILEQ